MGGLQAKSMTSQRYRAVIRWRICVTMATLWQQQDGGYALLFYIFNNTVIDWTCFFFYLTLWDGKHKVQCVPRGLNCAWCPSMSIAQWPTVNWIKQRLSKLNYKFERKFNNIFSIGFSLKSLFLPPVSHPLE